MPDETPVSSPTTDARRIALAAVGGGLSVILLAGGALAVAGAASADSESPSPAPSDATPPADRPPLGRLGGMALHGGLGMGLAAALHGTAVVKNSDGEFETVAGQRGEVTAVSATSIAVTSEDGYAATYVVDDDTTVNGPDGAITDITSGADVVVVATVDGDTQTATRVIEPAAIEDLVRDRLPLGGDLLEQFKDGDLLKRLQQNPMLKKLREQWGERHGSPTPTPSASGSSA